MRKKKQDNEPTKKRGEKTVQKEKQVSKKNTALGGVREDKLFDEYMHAYQQTGTTIQASYRVMSKYPKLSFDNLRHLSVKLNQYLADMTENSFRELFFKHAFVYNKIWRFFKSNRIAYGETKSLQFKERLFGFHGDEGDNIFEINNEIEMVTGSGFDFNKLNDHEKERLEQLLLKCRPIKQLKN